MGDEVKFKCEVEIDWIDEEDNLEDKVKREIAREVVKQIKEKDFDPILNMATETLKEKVDALAQETLDKFMDRKIVITDKWGNIEEQYGNVDELLQDKFDNYILEEVDSNGKPNPKKNCSFNGTPRIIHTMDRKIKAACDKFSESVLYDVDKRITNRLDKSLKEKVSNTLVKKIDLTSVLD
jgi:CRISPR/Cas system-associated endonuclease Cas3-HD